MSKVVEFVEDTIDFVGDVFETVGDAISDVADVAFDIVEGVGNVVGDVIERAIDNPLGTIAQIAAVATGNAWALPLVSAGTVIAQGGDLEDAVKAAGLSYVAQGVVNYAASQISGSAASNLVDYGGPIEYDGGAFSDYTPGAGGGAVDLGINPETGAVRMDFTGMAESAGDVYSPGSFDFGPGANTVIDGGGFNVGDLDFGPVIPDVGDFGPPVTDVYTPGTQIFDDGSSIQTFDDGSTLVTDSNGTVTATDIPNTSVTTPTETPYDPYADQGPSTTNPNVVGPDSTLPDLGEVEIVDTRPVVPDITEIPDLGEVVITDTRPPVTPVVPDADIPEIVITDDRPPVPPVVPDVIVPPDILEPPIVDPEPDVPEIIITDTRPPPPPDEPPVVLPPVVLDPPIIDPEPDVPEIVITDTRPPPPPLPPDVVLPPVIPEPPIVDPEPPVPPVVPPYVPPVIIVPPIPPVPPVVPPVVQPPVTPPPPPRTFGSGLNPGFIQPTAFYNTTNPNQSKFYWGGHGYQYGPTFNQQEYNQVAGPVTPFGLQGQAQPLTGQQISNVVQGQQLVQQPVVPATRIEQYRPDTRTPPSYGQIQLNPQYSGSAANRTATTSADNNMNKVTAQLGENWFNRQQAAANAGDWDNYYAIQKQVDNILYKP